MNGKFRPRLTATALYIQRALLQPIAICNVNVGLLILRLTEFKVITSMLNSLFDYVSDKNNGFASKGQGQEQVHSKNNDSLYFIDLAIDLE